MDTSCQPDDLAQLREQFPDWEIESRWTVAGTGPDSRPVMRVLSWGEYGARAAESQEPCPAGLPGCRRGAVLVNPAIPSRRPDSSRPRRASPAGAAGRITRADSPSVVTKSPSSAHAGGWKEVTTDDRTWGSSGTLRRGSSWRRRAGGKSFFHQVSPLARLARTWPRS
jgi:hypothetical protein